MAPDKSVLLIPAPEMVQVVGGFRTRFDPSARAGIPPHITVMFPFLEPNQLTSQTLSDLDSLFAATESFDYALTEVREFQQGVLYLAPEPAQPFIDLTALVSKRFGILPFGGIYPDVVPHLTVAQPGSGDDRKHIRASLLGALPEAARASEARLMVGNNETTWKTVHITPFR